MLKKYRSHSWAKMLRNYLVDWRLEQCPIPISTVTTDLISARSVIRSSGDAVDAILESINLPVLSPPICRDGMLLVDGGILNNLPADVLVQQGCNFAIGVDASANIEHRMGDNFPNTPTERMKTSGVVATLLRSAAFDGNAVSGWATFVSVWSLRTWWSLDGRAGLLRSVGRGACLRLAC